MGNIFSAGEVVELGIQIEKNGRDFYGELAARTDSPGAAELFKYLAAEEEKHILVFQKILDKAQAFQPVGLDSGDYYAYMRALAAEHVFTQQDKGKELARQVKDSAQAVARGIQAEEESIVFYSGMKKVVPEYGQKVIDEIIAQEAGHLRQLLELKKKA
jgi:rubrerythrin